jgi:hypothetical protein
MLAVVVADLIRCQQHQRRAVQVAVGLQQVKQVKQALQGLQILVAVAVAELT